MSYSATTSSNNKIQSKKKNTSGTQRQDPIPRLSGDEEDTEATQTRPTNQRKRKQVIPDDDDIESEQDNFEDDEDVDVVVERQANSNRTTTRPPLATRNKCTEPPHELAPNSELQKQLNQSREALRKSQLEVVQLKQKRKHAELDQGGPDKGDKRKKSDKSTKSSSKPKDTNAERERHARDLGKRFVFECMLWVDTRIVFGSDPGANADNDDADETRDLEDEQTREQLIAEPAGGWSLKTPAAIDAYTRFRVREFKKTLEPQDQRNWQRRWFKDEFCNGARKLRGDFLKGTANRPVELFSFMNVKTADFMDKAHRSELQEVKDLLEGDTFLLGDNDGPKSGRLYRSNCILKILLRIYWGPEAVLTGERSRMAHLTYGSKFKPKSVTLPQLATAAVVAKVILEGDAEFTDSNQERVEYYWKRLDFLHNLKNLRGDIVDATIKWINKKIGLGDEEDDEEVNELELEILKELGEA